MCVSARVEGPATELRIVHFLPHEEAGNLLILAINRRRRTTGSVRVGTSPFGGHVPPHHSRNRPVEREFGSSPVLQKGDLLVIGFGIRKNLGGHGETLFSERLNDR